MPIRRLASVSGRVLWSRLVAPLTLAMLVAAPALRAQQAPAPRTVSANGDRKVLGVEDYARWRSIGDQQISSDGRWVAYVLRYSNVLPGDAKPELHILNLDTNEDIRIEGASNPQFSPDARWAIYSLDSIPARRGGARDTAAGAQPPSTPAAAAAPARVELRELATGKTRAWTHMTTGTFAPTSRHLLLRRRAPQPPRPAGGAGGGANPTITERGSDVVVHDLTTGVSQFIGAVGDASFNRRGELLAYTVDAEIDDGNGLFVVDLANGSTRVLDNDAKIYGRLTWSDDGNGIAVLKGSAVDKMRERANALLVFNDLRANGAPMLLDPASDGKFPKGFVVSERAALDWSEDGARVFFGIMPQSATADTTRRRSTDSIADVDVWRTRDTRIQSQQMNQANADRNFTFRQAYDVARKEFVALTDSTMRDIQISADGRWAIGRDARAYIRDYGNTGADIYRVDVRTGERTKILEKQLTGQHILGLSPLGNHFLYWKNNQFQLYDLATGATRTLGRGAPSFINTNHDNPGPKPSFGIEGYTADARSVIVAHDYDLWLLPLDGTSPARNLTNGVGTQNEMRLRIVNTEPTDPMASRAVRTGQLYDLSKPLTLSAYGEYTKKAGFYKLADGKLSEIVYEDVAFSTPTRARNADRFLFTRQTFIEFPDLRVSGPDFRDARKLTNANPQQSEYVWGRRVLFDYTNKDGKRLQGILALPDDYRQGEKRPMLVTFYEKNSQNMHRYSAPSFITGMGTSPMEAVSRGYITMLPDIHFRTGSSHSDMLECVEAAVRKVIELGYADPARIGLNGHSYGGEGAAFIATRSKLFAAVAMGAGVTDLYSDFNQSWGWTYQVTGGSGANGHDYYLFGQGRWGFSPWDKPDVYHFESALTHVPNVTAPILIMHGTADPTVSFTEGMNFYNALRYNGKEAIMLAYPGEGHGLRGLANRRDLTTRFFQFFDHYLKGTAAPKWMTEGVPFLMKDQIREIR